MFGGVSINLSPQREGQENLSRVTQPSSDTTELQGQAGSRDRNPYCLSHIN